MNIFKSLLARFTLDPEVKKEIALVIAFKKNPQKHWEALMHHFEKSEFAFKARYSWHHSISGQVSVENDLYTYVYIDENTSSLSRANDYGLLNWQVDLLEKAILSCVPGYVGFEKKLKAKMEREGHVTTRT